MLGFAARLQPLSGDRGLTPAAESRRRRGARRPAPGGDCRCVAGQPGGAEDTYESSIQPEQVGTILEQRAPTAAGRLDSWRSSSSTVKVHLGDPGPQTHGTNPEAEGASQDCSSRFK